jgi:prepilin-type N-terminal cleavage/methylation domain-containing protein
MKKPLGFTLLELLIGMTLLGFILMLLFGGFRLAASAWNGIEGRAEQVTDQQAGISLLRRLIIYAQPLHWRQLPEQPLAFSGEPTALRMVTPLTGQFGLRVVELAIGPERRGETSGSTRQLILRHGPVRYDRKGFADSLVDQEERQLLGNLNGAAFSYFGPARRGEPPQWHEHWSNPDQFPTVVRLQVAPKGSTPVDLLVAPMANGDRFATLRMTPGPR